MNHMPSVTPTSGYQLTILRRVNSYMTLPVGTLAALMVLGIRLIPSHTSRGAMVTRFLTFSATVGMSFYIGRNTQDLRFMEDDPLWLGHGRSATLSSESTAVPSQPHLGSDRPTVTPNQPMEGNHSPGERSQQLRESDRQATSSSQLLLERHDALGISSPMPLVREPDGRMGLHSPSPPLPRRLVESDRVTTVSSQPLPSNPRSPNPQDFSHMGGLFSPPPSKHSGGSDTSLAISFPSVDRIVLSHWNADTLHRWRQDPLRIWSLLVEPERVMMADDSGLPYRTVGSGLL